MDATSSIKIFLPDPSASQIIGFSA